MSLVNLKPFHKFIHAVEVFPKIISATKITAFIAGSSFKNQDLSVCV